MDDIGNTTPASDAATSHIELDASIHSMGPEAGDKDHVVVPVGSAGGSTNHSIKADTSIYPNDLKAGGDEKQNESIDPDSFMKSIAAENDTLEAQNESDSESSDLENCPIKFLKIIVKQRRKLKAERSLKDKLLLYITDQCKNTGYFKSEIDRKMDELNLNTAVKRSLQSIPNDPNSDSLFVNKVLPEVFGDSLKTGDHPHDAVKHVMKSDEVQLIKEIFELRIDQNGTAQTERKKKWRRWVENKIYNTHRYHNKKKPSTKKK